MSVYLTLMMTTVVLAADAPAAGSDGGLNTVIVTAIGAAVAAAFTAMGPALVELVKRWGRTPEPKADKPKEPEAPEVTPQVAAQNAFSGLSQAEQTLLDTRRQRDEAARQRDDVTRRYYEVLDELEEAREAIRRRDVRIAVLEHGGARHPGRARPEENRNRYPS